VTATPVIFLAVLVIALASFALFLTRRVRYLLLGQPEDRSDHLGRRASGFVVSVFGQKKLFKEPVGILHFFIFWGFIVVAFGALQIIGEGLYASFSLPLVGGAPGFYLLQDLFIALVIVAVCVAAYVRYVVRPPRFEAKLEAGVILALIFAIMLAALLYNGLSYALTPAPSHSLAPLTRAVAGAVGTTGWGEGTLRAGMWTFWWLHALFILAFLVYIPVSKHLHLIACPVNEFFRNLKPPGGQIKVLDLEDEEVEEFGVGRVEGFTHWQLLDLYACTECGRCHDNCPAALSGKSLSPRSLMTKLRDHLVERGAALTRGGRTGGHDDGREPVAGVADAAGVGDAAGIAMIGDVISEDEIWACTTCYSCQEQCPVQNEHVNKIIDMRRSLVLDRGEFPQEAQLACRNVENNGNPWGIGAHTRGAWADELGVAAAGDGEVGEYLFWVGCAGAFDDRAVKISRAVVRLLGTAGVSFSILGTAETCCGDPMRRIGNEYLLQMLVAENVETLNGLGVTKIVTQCPHCLNTLKNEYPAFGGTYEVVHHTQLLADLLEQGRLPLTNGSAGTRVAYHDSCYLGRYQGDYVAPRRVLAAVPGAEVREARRNRAKSMCCGAGGGRMWMEEDAAHRVNELRVNQLLETQPEIIGVNCPYCLTMMEDGLGSVAPAEAVRVLDLAEILAERLPG
jgi:Fe-S oxidoreductase